MRVSSNYGGLNRVGHAHSARTHFPHISLDILVGPSQRVYNNIDGLAVGSTRSFLAEPNGDPMKLALLVACPNGSVLTWGRVVLW